MLDGSSGPIERRLHYIDFARDGGRDWRGGLRVLRLFDSVERRQREIPTREWLFPNPYNFTEADTAAIDVSVHEWGTVLHWETLRPLEALNDRERLGVRYYIINGK